MVPHLMLPFCAAAHVDCSAVMLCMLCLLDCSPAEMAGKCLQWGSKITCTGNAHEQCTICACPTQLDDATMLMSQMQKANHTCLLVPNAACVA
jgi:hypothetical protein